MDYLYSSQDTGDKKMKITWKAGDIVKWDNSDSLLFPVQYGKIIRVSPKSVLVKDDLGYEIRIFHKKTFLKLISRG